MRHLAELMATCCRSSNLTHASTQYCNIYICCVAIAYIYNVKYHRQT